MNSRGKKTYFFAVVLVFRVILKLSGLNTNYELIYDERFSKFEEFLKRGTRANDLLQLL